jgi:hypothetical protein
LGTPPKRRLLLRSGKLPRRRRRLRLSRKPLIGIIVIVAIGIIAPTDSSRPDGLRRTAEAGRRRISLRQCDLMQYRGIMAAGRRKHECMPDGILVTQAAPNMKDCPERISRAARAQEDKHLCIQPGDQRL